MITSFRFKPSLKMAFLTLILLAFFIRLGLWQLERADEKTKMLQMQAAMSGQAPLFWGPKRPLPEQYQALFIQGHYLQKTLLLDNQHQHHQFGYDVITPFELSQGGVVLVDRGWVRGDPSRQTFPEANISAPHAIRLLGQAYFPSSKAWILGKLFEKKRDDLIIIEAIDTKFMSKFLHKTVYPFIIRLNEREPEGYLRAWPTIAMSPERHKAYALQWFAMAFVLLLIFIGLNIKKRNEKGEI